MFKKSLAYFGAYIARARKEGFFHVIVGNLLVNCIAAISPLLFPRIMGAGDYATFNNATNILTYLMLFNGLGLANGILRYCSVFDGPSEKKSYFAFAVKFGFFIDFGIILIFGAVVFVLDRFGIITISYGSAPILAMLSFTALLAFLQTAIQNFLRANRENRIYAKTSVIYTLIYAVLQTGLAFLLKPVGKSMQGAAIGRYVAYAAAIILSIYMMRGIPAFRAKAVRLRRPEKVEMVKYSANALVASCFSLIMPVNEGLLLGFMVGKSDFGDFSAAQLVPQCAQYIANSVIIFVFPYFARHYLEGNWIYRNTKKMILGLSIAMAAVCGIGIAISPQITILFGSRFRTGNAVRLMRLFFITFGISGAIRIPVGNVLGAIGEIRFNAINAIFCSVVHIAVCWVLVYHFGIYGAAFGLMAGYLISGVAGIIYLRYYCRKLNVRRAKDALEENREDIAKDEQELL